MGFCINCDNRHGCRSDTPECIELMRRDNIKDTCGKTYLRSLNKLELCRGCGFFRSCWKDSEYSQAISGSS